MHVANPTVKLMAQTPCYGLLPMSHGTVAVHEVVQDHIVSIAPYKGKATALNKAMTTAYGLKYPAAGRVTANDAVRCQWAGHAHAFLIGSPAVDALSDLAAVTDQSDAWAIVHISGDHVHDVLARLIPMDLRPSAFKKNYTARTMVQHMAANVTRVGPDAFEIMVMRSMARTLVHDLETAMENVAARG